jgi:hypothetical protein
MGKFKKGQDCYFWISGGTGHKREFKIKAKNEEHAFMQLTQWLHDIYNINENDLKRWLHGKR